MARDDHDDFISRLRWNWFADQVLVRFEPFYRLWLKANFDPNQPRVPRGHPNGGQWTRVGGWRSTRDEDGRSPPDDIPFLMADSDPLEEEPDIPQQRPKTSRERTAVMRRAARIMLREGWRRSPAGRAIRLAKWLLDFNPFIEAYNDPPRTLDELHARVSEPRLGYDIHHIVEKRPALDDGFAKETVNGPNNLVLIPRLKHWGINSWFQTSHRALDDMTPRQYVQGKSWEERRRVGLMALIENGVLADDD